jgi:hypothetical protein
MSEKFSLAGGKGEQAIGEFELGSIPSFHNFLYQKQHSGQNL